MMGLWVSFVLAMISIRVPYEVQMVQLRARAIAAQQTISTQTATAGAADESDEDEQDDASKQTTSAPADGGKSTPSQDMAALIEQLEMSEREKSILEEACDAFETSDCEELALSEYSEIKIGDAGRGKAQISISNAEAGMVFFLAFLWYFILAGGINYRRSWLHWLAVIIAAWGVGYCLLLDYRMFFLSEKWCPLCLMSHVLTLAIFISLLLLWPRKPKKEAVTDSDTAGLRRGARQEEQPRPHRYLVILLPAVILLSTGLMHMYLMNVSNVSQYQLAKIVIELQRINLSNAHDKMESDKNLIARLKYARKAYKERYDYYNSKWQHTLTAWQIMPTVDIDLENIPFRGPADAPNAVVIYSDFQCPSCRVFAKTIEERIIPLSEKYGPARFYFKHWPICKEGCNPYAGTNLHPKACAGARAAEAAFQLGGNPAFWKMHDILFGRQKEWTGDTGKLIDYAEEIGLDPQVFKQKMDSDVVSRRIEEQAREGFELGKDKVDEDERKWVKVSGTPAVYINGKKLNSTHHVKTWVNILRMGVRAQQTPAPPQQN